VDTKQFWHPSTKNPANICRHIKGVGLVTVFAHKGKFKFGYGQGVDRIYSETYPTQHAAQLAVAELFKVPSAPRVDEEESSTTMSETAPAAPATEAPAQQYMTKAHWDKLMGYIKQLAASQNALESKVEALTAQVFDLTKVLTGVAEPGILARAQDRLTAGEVFAAVVTELDRAVAQEDKAAGA
jgi:hypothetical protein